MTRVLPTFLTSKIEGALMSYQSEDLWFKTGNSRKRRTRLTLAGEGVNDLLLDTLLALRQTLVLRTMPCKSPRWMSHRPITHLANSHDVWRKERWGETARRVAGSWTGLVLGCVSTDRRAEDLAGLWELTGWLKPYSCSCTQQSHATCLQRSVLVHASAHSCTIRRCL